MDRALVAAARRGDQAAFMDLVRPRSAWLFGIALQILRDIDRAGDALVLLDFAGPPADDRASAKAAIDSIRITPSAIRKRGSLR